MLNLNQYKNIFISVSCTSPDPNVKSVFTREERYSQLLNTIDSCKRFDNSRFVLLEGSQLSDTEIHGLGDIELLDLSKNKNVLENIHNKQLGTLNLWREALQQIQVEDESTMVFIAGRYTLTENFKIELNSDYAFKKENSWAGDTLKLFHTTCFKVKGKCKNEFIDTLSNSIILYKKTNLDVEHCFWYILQNKNIEYLDEVECIGNLGSSGILNINK
jgi:hypothetical protein